MTTEETIFDMAERFVGEIAEYHRANPESARVPGFILYKKIFDFLVDSRDRGISESMNVVSLAVDLERKALLEEIEKLRIEKDELYKNTILTT